MEHFTQENYYPHYICSAIDNENAFRQLSAASELVGNLHELFP